MPSIAEEIKNAEITMELANNSLLMVNDEHA